jgi:hypothetical protein
VFGAFAIIQTASGAHVRSGGTAPARRHAQRQTVRAADRRAAGLAALASWRGSFRRGRPAAARQIEGVNAPLRLPALASCGAGCEGQASRLYWLAGCPGATNQLVGCGGVITMRLTKLLAFTATALFSTAAWAIAPPLLPEVSDTGSLTAFACIACVAAMIWERRRR